jgi:drug/metabolite transporter (DMT)-like permease
LVLLRERVHPVALLGIVLLLGGIWAVRRPSALGAALAPAFATGVMIAAYSALDRVGVRLAPPWLYGFVLWLFAAVLLVGFTTVRRLPAAGGNPGLCASLLVGALMTAAYFMILVALSIAPLAIVAPLRESAIVLVTAWGIWRLHERRGVRLRIAGALAIVLGIGLLAFA